MGPSLNWAVPREHEVNRPQGKMAAVTGATLGLGHAMVTRMAEEGAAVAILDMLDDAGQALTSEMGGRGLKARYWHCDVRKEFEVARVIGEVSAHFGRLDVLVNNAGVSGANKPTHELTEAEWDWVQAINVKGVFFCTKHSIPNLRKACGGSSINLSSIYGLVGAPDAMIYAPDKIRVNSIHPGFIWSPMVEKHLGTMGDVAEGRKAVDALHPLGHVGVPDDIAWGAVYLASDEARCITGSELVIDGGHSAH